MRSSSSRVRGHSYGLIAAAVAAAAALAGCGGSSGPPVAPAATAFLSALGSRQDHAAAAITDAPTKARAALTAISTTGVLGPGTLRLLRVDQHGAQARATYAATVRVVGLGTWRYRNSLSLHRVHGRWLVHWSPGAVIPGMRPGDRLVETRRLPPRASILDRFGRPLFVPSAVVTIGVVPKLLKQRARTLRVLDAAAGLDAARVERLIAAATADQFVPLVTLRRSDYERIRAQVHPLPGVHFQTGTLPLAPTRSFARPLLGYVGAATSDALGHAGSLFTAADTLGLAGLQLAYQRRLAGTPTGRLLLQDRRGRRLGTLLSVRGHPGRPLQLTLDRRLQAAAETALDTTAHPAALVAVQTTTGDLLAVADRPADSFDRALTGLYPPGSAFKIITATALLGHGITPTTTVPCPARIVVDGKVFTNFEHEAFAAAPFATDFARSCNTAFIGLAGRIPSSTLRNTARQFGIGVSPGLPVPASSGQVPVTSDPVEHAADMIGQGRVLASPLAMALAAATAASGRWHAPRLLTNAPQPAGTPHPGAPPSAALRPLRQLMRLVVTQGTGTAANLPGAAVYGKTGTAEYENGNPPRTHAWFVGYRNDIAFAVIVENGGVGGRTAAPIAADFLRHAAALEATG